MLSVIEAIDAVLAHSSPIGVEQVPLSNALFRVIATDVVSGCDSPPFDKALMDGYAVRSEDTAVGTATLKVIESVTAGQVPAYPVGPGQATRIMTGAPMPAGADAVVPVERTMAAPQYDDVHVGVAVAAGANVLHRGESMRCGDRIFPAGHKLRPQDLGVLAEIGVASVTVRRRPRVAILATGDELVPPDATPGSGQIRNSNETLLAGLVIAAGCEAVPIGIARDEREHLRAKIDAGLACDMLLLSGGVSAGVLDLVPSVLQQAGVEQVFHKVNMKPGKPVWFGGRRSEVGEQRSKVGERGGVSPPRSPEDGDRKQAHAKCLVFGLPGNPVSTLVCFELFAKTALRKMMGLAPAEPQPFTAALTSAIENRGDRPTYHPARVTLGSDGGLAVTPVRWAGSGDLRATAEANCVAVLEANTSYTPGGAVGALLWSGSDIESSSDM